jgi:integrase
MRTFTDLPSLPSRSLASFTDQLRLAVAAYLARFQGSSRYHTESDLRCYLAWCAEHGLDPLAARRPHLELYIRWMQEIRRFKPLTVSRRFSVTAGFYRTCVIDGLLEHSPAEHVRRPSVPPESPTLGFTHLQFEALLTAARESPNPFDFALVVMLGLLGLRIFEATRADIADLGEEHGHRVLRVCGKGTKVVLIPLPPAVGRAIDRAIGTRTRGPILLNSRGARMDRHAASVVITELRGNGNESFIEDAGPVVDRVCLRYPLPPVGDNQRNERARACDRGEHQLQDTDPVVYRERMRVRQRRIMQPCSCRPRQPE